MSRDINLTTYDSCCIGEKTYFFVNECNAIGCINFESNKIELFDGIPEELTYSKELVSQLVSYRDNIIVIPLHAKNIWSYNIYTKKWKMISIKCEEQEYKFMRAIIYNDGLYILPSRFPTMIHINLKNNNVTYLNNVTRRFHLENKKNYRTVFRSDIVCIDSIIYAACCIEDSILKYDMKTDCFEWISAGTGWSGYSGIGWDGKMFWLTPRENINKVILWDGEKCIQEISLPDSKGNFIRGITIGKDIVYIKKDKSTICVNKNNVNDISICSEGYFFMNIDEISKSLTYSGIYSEKRNKEKKQIKLSISYLELKDFFEKRQVRMEFVRNNVLKETGIFSLVEYIENI